MRRRRRRIAWRSGPDSAAAPCRPDLVALVGYGAHGPAWVAGARLAGFVPGSEYFGT